MGFDVKALQLIDRQVNASALRVFAYVADDVGHLQGLAQGVGVNGGLGLGLAKNGGSHFAHHAGDQVAVTLQVGVVQVAGLLQVHLAALNHALQVVLRNAVRAGVRHERLHHGVAGAPGVGLGHFGAPPRELGSGNA